MNTDYSFSSLVEAHLQIVVGRDYFCFRYPCYFAARSRFALAANNCTRVCTRRAHAARI